MKTLSLLSAVAFLVTASAPAQCPHDDPDNICIVFDHPGDCCQNCWPPDPAAIPYHGELTAFVVLQNASAAAGVQGYQFWLCREDGRLFEAPPGCAITGYELPPGAVNVETAPRFAVAFDPLPWAPCIRLLAIHMAISGDECWCFGVKPNPIPGIPPGMPYADGGDPGHLIAMVPCNGLAVEYSSCQMSCINCELCPPGPPVANESATWGAIKSLFP